MSDLTAVSLFAGIGGFDLALQRAGVKVVAAVEIDPAARKVLARHFPDTVLFEDVREVTGDALRAAGFVPERGILTGGFPCQDLSVAGRRRGMGEGTRSGLYWEIDRLMAELHPAWVFLENVPGLLSAVCPCPGTGEHDGCSEPHHLTGGSCKGGCFPAHGGAMGLVLGSLGDRGYGFAYRVLDAQHFGVPQRRRRVLIVGRAGGDARGPVEVLLEPDGGDRHSSPGRQTGQVVAALTANGVGGGGGPDDNAAQAGHLIAATVSAKWAKGVGGPAGDEAQNLLPVAFGAAQITSKTNRSNPKPGDPAPSLAATGSPHVAHTLTSGVSSPGVSRPGRRSEDNANLVVETLRSHPRPGSNSVGAVVPVAMRGRGEGARIETGEPGDPAFTLRTPGGGSSYPMIAATADQQVTHAANEEPGTVAYPVAWRGRGMELGEAEVANALRSSGDGHVGDQMGYVMAAMAVRRLTPLECERLQGFPDRWTAGQSDAARYRQLGNTVAVPCIEWVSHRVVAVDARQEAAA